jgi:hypothetical protein
MNENIFDIILENVSLNPSSNSSRAESRTTTRTDNISNCGINQRETGYKVFGTIVG